MQGYAEGLAECINDDEESRNFTARSLWMRRLR
ncbi:MAG: hypothetical protein ACLTSZ_04005 [Lachnospiraceae bacterium]